MNPSVHGELPGLSKNVTHVPLQLWEPRCAYVSHVIAWFLFQFLQFTKAEMDPDMQSI